MSKELVEQFRRAIDAGLVSFCSDEPDFTMSPTMRRIAAEHILAQPLALSHLPDREEVARVLAEEFGTHDWDQMADTHRELKIWYRNSTAYDINDITRDDCYTAADRILAMMEGRG